MATLLTTKNPLVFPTVTVPTNSDSPAYSGETLNTLTQLKDRTDYLISGHQTYNVRSSCQNILNNSAWSNIPNTTIVIPNVNIGDQFEVLGCFETQNFEPFAGETLWFTRLGILLPNATTFYNTSNTASPGDYNVAMNYLYTATQQGTHTLSLSARATASGYYFSNYVSLDVTHYRRS